MSDEDEKYSRLKQLKERFLCLVESQINGDLKKVDAKELGEVVDMFKDCAETMKYCAETEYYEKITKAMEANSDEDNAYYMTKYAPETMMDGRYYRSRPPMMYYSRGGGKYYSRDGRRYFKPDIDYSYMEWDDDWEDTRAYDRDMDRNLYGMNRMYYTNTNSGSNSNMSNSNMSDSRNYESMTKSDGSNGTKMNNQPYDAYTANRRTYMEMKNSGADKSQTLEEIKKTMSSLTDSLMPVMQKATPEEKSIIKQNLNTLVSKVQ